MKTKDIMIMFIGVCIIGVGIAGYRLSGFGADPFTSMNLAISHAIGWSFGTWQLLLNAIILLIVFKLLRHNIGIGTVVNMVLCGYVSDFLCWIVLQQLQVDITMLHKIAFLLMGIVVLPLGCSMYMLVKLGYAPYDNIAFIFMDKIKCLKEFARARVVSDVGVVCIALFVCLFAKIPILSVIGLGTIVNALLNGPLVQFYNHKLTSLLLDETAQMKFV